jgi:hypothetical protein
MIDDLGTLLHVSDNWLDASGIWELTLWHWKVGHATCILADECAGSCVR